MSAERKTVLRANSDLLMLLDRRLADARQTRSDLQVDSADSTSFLPSFISVLDKDKKTAGIQLVADNLSGAVAAGSRQLPNPSGFVDIDSDSDFLLSSVFCVAEVAFFDNEPGGTIGVRKQGFRSPLLSEIKLKISINNKQGLTDTAGNLPPGGSSTPAVFSPALGFDGLSYRADLPNEMPLARNTTIKIDVDCRLLDPLVQQNPSNYILHVLLLGTKVFA